MRPVAIPFLLCLLLAAPAIAQTPAARGPAERQVLVDLAQTLGEAHALRQLCNGPADQFWRDRMVQMLQTEAGDIVFEERLRRTFNAGYEGLRARFPACTAASRRAEEEVGARGRALASRLAGAERQEP